MQSTSEATRRATAFRVLLVCALTTGPASAGGAVDERMAADPRDRVEVRNAGGRVEIEGWEREEVSVQGRIDKGVKEVRFERTGGTIEVEVMHDSPIDGLRDHGEARLTIKVPRASSVRVESVSADVVADGLTGYLEVEAVSGDVAVDVGSRRVALKSVIGDLEARSTKGRVEALSVGGDIRVRLGAGDIAIGTVSGDIDARVDSLRRGSFKSMTGDLRFEGDLAAFGRLELDTKGGDIELRLPAQASAEVELKVSFGRIESDFGSGGTEPDAWRMTLGGGGARLEASTFSGDIELRRR